jgi:arylsulfatase A-like enzyme
VLGIWYGVLTGFVEGCGLILFQRLNWPDWGAMLHVSAPILWVAPLVDSAFFVGLALLIGLISKVIPRLPAFPVLGFLLSFFAAYGWLTLTGRLYHRSCLLLALGIASVVTRWAVRNEAKLIRFWARTLLVLIVVVLGVFAVIHWGSKWKEHAATKDLPVAAAGSPNVLVVVIDTLRADHVHSYGYSRETTPNIDRLASEGTVFENAVSPTPWSLPSHVSLLTGRYQFEHRIEDIPPMSMLGLRQPEMNGFTTIGEVLQGRGYRTAAFSANRVNFTADLGFGRGFLHFEDYFQSLADAFLRTVYGREFARIYLNRTEHSKVKRLLRWLGFNSLLDKSDEGSIKQIGALGAEKRADEVNRELLRWVDSGDGSPPFFGFLNYIDVHHPYGGPAWFATPWKDNPIDLYDSGIRYVDEQIGLLMEEMQKRGLDRNTLVVITSDHGESLGEHHIAFHGESLYREQVHVPLIFWFPGHIPLGIRVPTLVSNASIPATLVSVLGFAPVNDFRRPAIDTLWKDPRATPADIVLSEVAQLYPASDEDIASQTVVPVSMDGPMKSVLTPEWQLVTHAKFGNQLFNYAKDAGETHDGFRSADSQGVAGDLALGLQQAIAGAAGNAQQIGIGTTNVDSDKTYRIDAPAGSVVQIQVVHDATEKLLTAEGAKDSQRAQSTAFLPVITVSGRDGEVLQSCRNYGDEHIPKPGIADPTPQAFDDLCVNTTVAAGDSRLDISVPGKRGTPVELYLRITDWDGRAVPGGFPGSVGVAVKSK